MLGRWRWLAAAALWACSPEYQLIRTAPATGGVPGEGGQGPAVAAGTGTANGGGVDAVGGNGGLSAGGQSSGGAGVGGTGEGGVGDGAAGVGGTGVGGTCASHLDCGSGTVCSASRCAPCPDAPSTCTGPCEHGFQPVLAEHNGCVICECAPPSSCSSSTDCAAGEECYPGAQCEPGCTEPSCCAGNHCSAAGCAGSPIPHCLIAGCAGGAVCLAACRAVTCECEGEAWSCAESPATSGALGASCPQACVSP